MTRSLTRRELLERAALGGAALTLPGFLAACGGDDARPRRPQPGRAAQLASQLVRELAALHRRRRGRRSGRRSTSSRARRASPSTTSRRSTRTTSTSGRSRARSRAARDRPRHHRPHRQLALSRADGRGGVGGEARQGRDPEHRQPRRRAQEPALRPRPLLAAVAVGHDRDRLQREADVDPDHLDRAAARGSEAEGEDDAPLRDGGHARRRHAGERRRPHHGHRRHLQARSTASRRLSTRATCASSPATTTPARSRRATSSPRSRGRATSSSSRPTTRT